MSNEKKNSILEFIKANYPDKIETDYDRGCAYACDEIEKLLDEDDSADKIAKFIKDEINNYFDYGEDDDNDVWMLGQREVEANLFDYYCGSYDLCQDVEELLNREEGSIMIKHMKAPTECDKCLFCREKRAGDYGSYGYCLLLDQEGINLLAHNKLSDCPIVEVEHPNN